MILRYVLKTIWGITSHFGIMGHTDPTFDLKINVGLSDLYLMVQWFCLISPRLFDAWVSYFQIMRQCDPNFDLKVNRSQHDLYRKTGNFRVVQFSRNFAVSISPRKLKSAKYFPIFEKLVLRNWWHIWLQFAVVTYSPAVRPVICNYLKTNCHYKPFDRA